MTGVDQNDPPSGYNDSFLRLDGNDLSVEDFFQPDDASYLAANDADLGSGSPVLMPDNSSSTPHEIIGGGKDGKVFVVNRDNMGSFSPTSNNVIETVQTGVQQFDNIFSTPAYWNGMLYLHCEADVLRAFSWSNGQLSSESTANGQNVVNVHGATSRFRRTARLMELCGRSTTRTTIAAAQLFCEPMMPQTFRASCMTALKLDRAIRPGWL